MTDSTNSKDTEVQVTSDPLVDAVKDLTRAIREAVKEWRRSRWGRR